jgi:hypothetical protein
MRSWLLGPFQVRLGIGSIIHKTQRRLYMKPDVGQSPWLDADRHAQSHLCLAGGSARGMYHRALAAWALDVLATTQPVVWSQPDAFADFHNRDWHQLYAGSILDD